MKRIIIGGMLLTAFGLSTPKADAQDFAIKAYDNLGLGKAMSTTNAQPGQTSKSNFNAFGIDFGYTFWRGKNMWLEANLGVGYSAVSSKFSIPELSYHYSAPANADEDGNPYERYYELSDLSQKGTLGYVNIPIYLQYEYKPLKWLGIYANAGVTLGFRCYNSVGTASGQAYAYGVFPEYDDLLIDEPYLDDFGERYINGSGGKANANGFAASVVCGAGFEFYTYEPVSFVVGIQYNQGLTHSYKGNFDITSPSEYTADTAPVTYTVAGGTQVKPLSDYVTKSRLAPLTLHMGVNVRF